MTAQPKKKPRTSRRDLITHLQPQDTAPWEAEICAQRLEAALIKVRDRLAREAMEAAHG